MIELLHSLETHKSNSLYLTVFSEIVQGVSYNRKDLVFFVVARDHIINYLKHLKGSTSSMLLIKSKSFNISQCLSMIKNIVKIYYTEEIEIFFIEHFFKYLNSPDYGNGGQRNVKIHNFIGILVGIFKGLRDSGLTFKDLLTDFEERERSRSRSREILKKENCGDIQSIFSGEKPQFEIDEDDYIFDVSASKRSVYSKSRDTLSSRRDSLLPQELNLEEIYLEKKNQPILDEKPKKNFEKKILGENKRKSHEKIPSLAFKTASSKKSKVGSCDMSVKSKISDNFNNLPKLSQKEMEVYLHKSFGIKQSLESQRRKNPEKPQNKEPEQLKPRYSSRDNIYTESSRISYSEEMGSIEEEEDDDIPLEPVEAIDISVSEQRITSTFRTDFEASELGEKICIFSPNTEELKTSTRSQHHEYFRMRKQGQGGEEHESFIQIEDQESEIMRRSYSALSEEKGNVFKTDNSSEVAASIFKTSLRNRNEYKTLSVVDEQYDDYDTSKFGSRVDDVLRRDEIRFADFGQGTETSVESLEEEKKEKILVDKFFKSKFPLKTPSNYSEAEQANAQGNSKEKQGIEKRYESEESLVQGTRAIRETLRNKIDLVLDDIIDEDNRRNSNQNLENSPYYSNEKSDSDSVISTNKDSSEFHSFKAKAQPTTFNPYEKERNFINFETESDQEEVEEKQQRQEEIDQKMASLFQKRNIEERVENFEDTDKKMKSISNLASQGSYPSILKTDNEQNLFSIFDQLTLKSTRREFDNNVEETPLKPTNLDKDSSMKNILEVRKNSKNNRPKFGDVQEENFNNYYEDKENSVASGNGVFKGIRSTIFTSEVMKKKGAVSKIGDDSGDNYLMSSKESSTRGKFREEMIVQNLKKLSSAGKENFVFEL